MENLERIMLEAFEIAFVMANQNPFFGPSKILDLIEQIIPSAYVYGTGYWVFYDFSGQLICVCRRYGLACKHELSKTHCLDTTPMAEEQDVYLYNKKTCGAVIPDYASFFFSNNIFNDKVETTTHLMLRHVVRVNDQVRCLKKVNMKFNIVFSRVKELRRAEKGIVFYPHPTTHPQYGEYFTKLFKMLYTSKQYKLIMPRHMPKVTIYGEGEAYVEVY